jgi:MFS-type transporter involved in bile tolerance (Atg22 family)
MIFNFWIMGHVPEHFTLIIISIGVFYGIAFTWVCLKVKEGDYPPPPPLDPSHNTVIKSFSSGVKVYFKECFSNSYYIIIFTMIMTSTMSFLPLNTFAIPYAKSLQIDMATYGKYLALTYMFSLVLAFPLGWLADKFHPLRVCMVALVGYIIVSIIGFTYATTTSAYLVAWVLHGVLSGCYLTSAASIGQRLFPRQKFAQFASAALLFAAPLHMTLGPLVGVVIDSTGNSYRYTFAAGLVLACIGLFTSWLVYLRFLKLGGPGFYQPPA